MPPPENRDGRTKAELTALAAQLAAARSTLDPDASVRVLTIEEQFAAIARGDLEATLRQAAPDVELEIFAPPEFPFVRRARGIDAVRDAIARNFAAVQDQQPVISNVVAQQDVVVLIGSERGRIRETGAAYHVEFVHRFTFAGEALASVRIIAARTT